MNLEELIDFRIVSAANINLTLYNFLLMVAIFLGTVAGLYILKKVFKRVMRKYPDQENRSFWSVFLLIRYVVWVIIIVVLLDTAGVKISMLLASIAALLVGVGLGIQQLFNDISSGVVLLIEQNLKINDVIQLEDGTVGVVVHIGLRTSKIQTRDNIIAIVPNSQFVNDRIVNWSHMDFKTRFHIDVGVAYGSDVELVTKVLESCADGHEDISQIPKPFVRFNNFGDSSLEFQLFFWVENPFYVENIKSKLRYSVNKAFRDNQIQIPFPQRDVHIIN